MTHHLPGHTEIQILAGTGDAVYMAQNAGINAIWSYDLTFLFQMDNFNSIYDTEILYAKGKPDVLGAGSWAILNDNGYLKIILHDADGAHFLVYKSTFPVLRTRIRKVFALVWSVNTGMETIYMDSVPISFAIDTTLSGSLANFSSFTGIRVTTQDIEYGSDSLANSWAFGSPKQAQISVYYDELIPNEKLNQAQVNSIYIEKRDTRVLPDIGKILFISDRSANGHKSIWQMDEFGQDIAPYFDDGTDIDWVNFSRQSSDRDTFLFYADGGGLQKIKKATEVAYNLGIVSPANATTHTLFFRGASITADGAYAYFPSLSSNASLPASSAIIAKQDLATNAAPSNIEVIPAYEMYPDINLTGDKIVFIKAQATIYANPQTQLCLYNITTNTNTVLLNSFTPTNGNNYDYTMEHCKFSPNDSKIGFSYKTSLSSDYSVCTINSDGSNFQVLENNAVFCAWLSEQKILFSRYVTPANKWQLFTRDLVTNTYKNLSKDLGVNDTFAAFKA